MSDEVDGSEKGSQAKPSGVGGSVARNTAATAKGVGRGVGRASKYAFTQARRAASAEGAEASGLSRLIEMHAFNTAGDAAVAIALAGSLFFQVPGSGGESSRESVALFLGLTMLPFAIVAPLLGPFLDRIAHGRRWAIGVTMAIRAFLCWILAGALIDQSAAMFPAALGVLVASKSYGVTKAAAVPRLVPAGVTLVKANGRVAMAGIVGVCVSAPIAGLASLLGPEWVLRWAFVVFIGGTVMAIRLPRKVDSNTGEASLAFRRDTVLPDLDGNDEDRGESTASSTGGTRGANGSRADEGAGKHFSWEDEPHQISHEALPETESTGEKAAADSTASTPDGDGSIDPPTAPRPRLRHPLPPMEMPAAVAYAMRANCAPKWLYGFLLMFMAFLLQENPISGWSPTLLIAIVAGSAGAGNFLGVTAASLVKNLRPAFTVSAVMIADVAVAVCTALFYSVPMLVVLGLVTGLGASLAKFSLDSTIQAHVPASVQTSAFARSDTMLQLAWVIGGFVGIILPLHARLGFTVAAVVLGAWTAYILISRPSPQVKVG